MLSTSSGASGYPFMRHVDAVHSASSSLKKVGIHSVVYVQLYHTGERVILTNNPDWQTHFLDNNYNLMPVLGCFDFPKNVSMDKAFLSSSCLPDIPEIRSSMRQFDIGQTLIAVERFTDYVEYMFFSAHIENKTANNFYFNNQDFFVNYIHFFRSKLSEEIKESCTHKIQLPLPDHNHPHASFKIYNNDLEKKVKTFKSEIKLYEIYVTNAANIGLSDRERQCIHHMCLGLTAKQTGKELSLSQRTIEYYLDNIKNKVGVKSKFKLIELFKDLWIK